MIKERMLELLLLERIVSQTNPSQHGTIIFNGKQYDNKRIHERFTKVLEEFLEPYVIESDSKE